MPRKDKGKGKGNEGSSSGGQSKEVRATHVFEIVLDELQTTYTRVMESIPRALRQLLLRLAPRRKRGGKTLLHRVHKKLYTLKEGTYMILVKPSRDSPMEQHLHLLFRWFDLYYIAYHCKGDNLANFYDKSCPNALYTNQTAVRSAVAKENRMGASLLRLHFRDCFVNASVAKSADSFMLTFSGLLTWKCKNMQGCDGSVLLDDTPTFTGEKTAVPNNNSLCGFDVIDSIKAQIEGICPQVVSCADILAVAARDSVVALGGPTWVVNQGRRDSMTASLDAANSDIPAPTLDLSDLTKLFSNKGLSTTDMIALSGGHTIGQARCVNFRNRIYSETDIDTSLLTSLKSNCPNKTGDNNISPLDASTPYVFDNFYYKNLLNKKGVLHSDQQLFNGGSADSQTTTYSSNMAKFFTDFSAAIVKMGNISPLTGSSGQIRKNCRKVN